ncbi:MAG: sulfite exporter TauE/SafE family protein [Candidatus Omnitrophica bacterium]|nr:sulfite exporter TauE/SafE family protein [Candidatus Omnitrophota bacterium]
MKLLFNFLLSGILVGWSLCILRCGLLLIPSIGNVSLSWKDGLKNGFLFGFGKTLSFSILGGFVSYSHYLFENFFTNRISQIIVGSLFILYGLWFYITPEIKKIIFKLKFSLSPFFLGILYGFTPCGPNFWFLVYLSYVTKGILFGIIAGVVFSFGTIIGPVLILSILSPYIWNKFNLFTIRKKYSKIFGVAIYFFWGINLILKN